MYPRYAQVPTPLGCDFPTYKAKVASDPPSRNYSDADAEALVTETLDIEPGWWLSNWKYRLQTGSVNFNYSFHFSIKYGC